MCPSRQFPFGPSCTGPLLGLKPTPIAEPGGGIICWGGRHHCTAIQSNASSAGPGAVDGDAQCAGYQPVVHLDETLQGDCA